MYVIGLTGGVGSGKTEAAYILAKIAHAQILLADDVGHLVMESGTKTCQKIIEVFGASVVGEDGKICRDRLAEIVFSDTASLERLNALVHPAVKEYLVNFISERREQDGYIILESAIMFETGCDLLCDEVWYLFVPEQVRKERLRQSRGYSYGKTEQLIGRQMSEAEFRYRCRRTISNDGNLEDLKEKLKQSFTSVPNCML